MFKKPEAEIVLFATQDIVTTSPAIDDNDNGTQLPGGDEF